MPRINEVQRRAIREELAKRKAAFDKRLFDRRPEKLSDADEEFFKKVCGPHVKQYEFVTDESKRIGLLCPRRTAKTTGAMLKVLRTSKRFPQCDIAYVVPSSKEYAKRLFWSPLHRINEQFSLGMEFKVGEHRVITREKSSIYVFGAKNKESPMYLRGSAWALVMLDECKDFGAHFESLIVEAVSPALEDYEGQLIMAGTPGEVQTGLFYEVTKRTSDGESSLPGWSIHRWIKSDNPFLPASKRDLDAIEKEEYVPFGLTKHSAKFKREQLAEWVSDDNERAYQYNSSRNAWAPDEKGAYALPEGHEWMYCLGVDLGERDANAFVVGAFSLTCYNLFIVYEYSRSSMSIDEIAGEIKHIQTVYSPMVNMVADTGGYGRGIVTDLQLRHNLMLEPADKTGNKLGNIAQMNSDFLSGRIRAREGGPCAVEWMRLVRRIRPTDKKVLITHSDLGDAALYMWKASRHYAAAPKEVAIVPDSPEYYAEYERQATLKAVQRRNASQRGDYRYAYGQAYSSQVLY